MVVISLSGGGGCKRHCPKSEKHTQVVVHSKLEEGLKIQQEMLEREKIYKTFTDRTAYYSQPEAQQALEGLQVG